MLRYTYTAYLVAFLIVDHSGLLNTEDEGTKILRNVGSYIPVDRAEHPKRLRLFMDIRTKFRPSLQALSSV